MGSLQLKRGTRAALDIAAANSELKQAELYYLTDEEILVVGTSVNTYTEFGSSQSAIVGRVGLTNAYVVGTSLSKPIYSHVDYDTASSWDSGNNWWQPSTPGYYRITASIRYNSNSAAFHEGQIWKNGASFAETAEGKLTIHAAATVYMNGTTDYADSRFKCNASRTAYSGSPDGWAYCYTTLHYLGN